MFYINSSEPKLLATTALEDTWGTDEPLLFLGEWCLLYDRKDVWSKRDYTIVPHHWDDREKLKRDYRYLYNLHDSLLKDLALVLNQYHHLDRDVRYWQMIIDPWLLTYIAVVFDRWECLRIAFEEHEHLETKDLQYPLEHKTPYNYTEFLNQVTGDLWNYHLFLDIIQYEYMDKCLIHKTQNATNFSFNVSKSQVLKLKRDPLKERFGQYIDRVLCKVSQDNSALFYTSYFPLPSLLKLNFALRQVPCLYLKDFEWPREDDFQFNPPSRNLLTLTRPAENAFEDYLQQRLVNDLPYAYVEGFSAILKRVKQIPFRPKVIFTANAHWNNEVFKIYSAEQVHTRGGKFVTMTHGGCIPAQFDLTSFEEDIADVKTTWAVPHHPKHVQLPPNKLTGSKIQSSKECCAVVGFEMPRYSFSAGSHPIAGQVLANYQQVCDLHTSLNNDIKQAFRVRPYTNLGWNTMQRFIDTLGAEKVSTEQSYYQFLSCARVIVCTYPQTTFSEAMSSGLPTILLYPAHLWETIPELDPLLETLTNAGIVFVDPKAAADHLNDIWANPNQWWNSQNVVNARQEFHRQACKNDTDWVKQWTAFAKTLLRND